MKLSIERAILLKAVSQAQSVVERRNTIPILANVLIEAKGDNVSFRATDLDIEILDRVTGVVERPGASTVSAVTLHEIVRKLPDGSLVTLADDGVSGRLTVEAGRSNFSLATLPKEDFPEMTTSEYTVDFTVSAMTLRRLFDKSKFAISTEETRYYLNGVYLHVAEGDDGEVLVPEGRYSKMGNVWFIPSVPTLCSWLAKMKFSDIEVIDISTTTSEEQRATDWMTFHSLTDFLDPNDSTKTAEGHPAPQRVVVVATA